ncbi:MAG: hypothetical protein AABY22_24855 [Nanoarchaeota archaeon]
MEETKGSAAEIKTAWDKMIKIDPMLEVDSRRNKLSKEMFISGFNAAQFKRKEVTDEMIDKLACKSSEQNYGPRYQGTIAGIKIGIRLSRNSNNEKKEIIISDAVEFADWKEINGWKMRSYDDNGIVWQYRKYIYENYIYKTTPELYEIFKSELAKQKTS